MTFLLSFDNGCRCGWRKWWGVLEWGNERMARAMRRLKQKNENIKRG